MCPRKNTKELTGIANVASQASVDRLSGPQELFIYLKPGASEPLRSLTQGNGGRRRYKSLDLDASVMLPCETSIAGLIYLRIPSYELESCKSPNYFKQRSKHGLLKCSAEQYRPSQWLLTPASRRRTYRPVLSHDSPTWNPSLSRFRQKPAH